MSFSRSWVQCGNSSKGTSLYTFLLAVVVITTNIYIHAVAVATPVPLSVVSGATYYIQLLSDPTLCLSSQGQSQTVIADTCGSNPNQHVTIDLQAGSGKYYINRNSTHDPYLIPVNDNSQGTNYHAYNFQLFWAGGCFFRYLSQAAPCFPGFNITAYQSTLFETDQIIQLNATEINRCLAITASVSQSQPCALTTDANFNDQAFNIRKVSLGPPIRNCSGFFNITTPIEIPKNGTSSASYCVITGSCGTLEGYYLDQFVIEKTSILGVPCNYTAGFVRNHTCSVVMPPCPVNCRGSFVNLTSEFGSCFPNDPTLQNDPTACGTTVGHYEEEYIVDQIALHGGTPCKFTNGTKQNSTCIATLPHCPVNCSGHWNISTATPPTNLTAFGTNVSSSSPYCIIDGPMYSNPSSSSLCGLNSGFYVEKFVVDQGAMYGGLPCNYSAGTQVNRSCVISLPPCPSSSTGSSSSSSSSSSASSSTMVSSSSSLSSTSSSSSTSTSTDTSSGPASSTSVSSSTGDSSSSSTYLSSSTVDSSSTASSSSTTDDQAITPSSTGNIGDLSSDDSNSTPIGLIVGVVIGGFFFLLCLLILLLLLLRSREAKKQHAVQIRIVSDAPNNGALPVAHPRYSVGTDAPAVGSEQA